jgi:hypothetical protein
LRRVQRRGRRSIKRRRSKMMEVKALSTLTMNTMNMVLKRMVEVEMKDKPSTEL